MFSNLKELNHHAYCIETGGEDLIAKVILFLEKAFNFKVSGNPDFFILEREVFGINDSRVLKDKSSMKPIFEKKIIIVSFDEVTREAQNSLLKLFEEPTEDTHFFILTPTSKNLLPTLSSRLQILKSGIERNIKTDFLSKNIPERLKIVEELSSGYKDDSVKKREIKEFLNDLQMEINLMIENSDADTKVSLKGAGEDVIKSCSFMESRSPSVKIILENLALNLPVIG